MKVILDTNIWYAIDTNPIFSDKDVKKSIVVTYLNYFELIKKRTIITEPELFRRIFIAMDSYEKIFEPPFVYMAKLYKFYHYHIFKELGDQISFISNFKNGDYIDPSKEKDFIEYISHINSDFQELVDSFNQEAKLIKTRIKNLQKHRERNSLNDTSDFVLFLIKQATKQNFDFSDISKLELLIETLNSFFKKMEVGELIMNANDVADFLMLSYVQPGDKYYTEDKKWKKLIVASGKESYLLRAST